MDDRKITVAVCGDSFCAGSVHDLQAGKVGRRAHFSQMLEDVYGYRVLHYAHGGFSNLAILFQLQEAEKQGADVVVYTTTWSSRFEMIKHEKYAVDGSVLKNFFYFDPCFESTNTDAVGGSEAPILSNTPANIEHSPFLDLNKDQLLAIEMHYKYFHSDHLKTITDSWLFEYWHQRLEKAGVLPILLKQQNIGQIAYDFALENPTFDAPFHTPRDIQEQIAANIHRYIVDNLPQKV